MATVGLTQNNTSFEHGLPTSFSIQALVVFHQGSSKHQQLLKESLSPTYAQRWPRARIQSKMADQMSCTSKYTLEHVRQKTIISFKLHFLFCFTGGFPLQIYIFLILCCVLMSPVKLIMLPINHSKQYRVTYYISAHLVSLFCNHNFYD